MDLHIDDLKLSNYTKNTLHELGFTMISDLEGHDFNFLMQVSPLKRYRVYSIIQELNAAGYLLPPDNAVSIYDVPMSKRLFNILERNYIFYLSQLALCSKEEIACLRNLGEQTMIELEDICQTHHIELRSVQSIKDNLASYHLPFTSMHYNELYKYNITSIDDFSKITTHDLHIICLHYYNDTMKAYYILKDNGVVFQAWEDQYLFELLSGKIAQKLSRRYRIDTISRLRSCSAEYIESMPSAILPSVNAVLAEYQNKYLL
ncbi:MAG: hypothetical protein HFJ09_09415 [Lachnospiraceae bacterium]|nr:hypothetical protein [Lachnospiraceae bacterium]